MFRKFFLVPNSWFGVFDEMPPVIAQASLDGSYARDQSPNGRIFAYGGWVGFDDAWRAFAPAWNDALNANNLEYFRSTEARLLTNFREVREKLARAAKDCGLHAIGSSVDVTHLTPTDASRKRDVFEHVVHQLLAVVPAAANVALMCDREQDLAKEVAAWLERLRWEKQQQGNATVYDRITGICYLNSRHSLHIQAADMAASLFREHAEQQAERPGSPPDPVLELITGGLIQHQVKPRSGFLGG